MPLCTIKTNLTSFPEGFKDRLTQLVVDTLNKDRERVTLCLLPGVDMCRNGSSAPMVMAEISAIAVFEGTQEDRDRFSVAFLDFFAEELGLEDDRIVLVYSPLQKQFLALRPAPQ